MSRLVCPSLSVPFKTQIVIDLLVNDHFRLPHVISDLSFTTWLGTADHCSDNLLRITRQSCLYPGEYPR